MKITDQRMMEAALVAAEARYGGCVDFEDRVQDAVLGLVEAEARFKPREGQKGDGYQVQYGLAWAAGGARRGADQEAEPIIQESDLGDLGIEGLWSPGALAEEPLWTVGKGKVMSMPEIITHITENEDARRVAKRILDVADDNSLRVELLRQLDLVIERETAQPAWVVEPPAREAAVSGALEDITITRRKNGHVTTEIVPGDVLAGLVEAASTSEAPVEDEAVWYEDRWDAQSAGRPVAQMARDRAMWPEGLLEAWGTARYAWTFIANPSILVGYLRGEDIFVDDFANAGGVEAMTWLQVALEELVDEDSYERVAKSVARSLAEWVVKDGLCWRPDHGTLRDVLADAIAEYFGIDLEPWEPQGLQSTESVKLGVETWLKELKMWQSQRVGIKALLNGASPKEAKAAANREYEIAHGCRPA